MHDLDKLFFRKYAIDPDSELDESDIYIDTFRLDTDKTNSGINTQDENDWLDME
jgi:hypothetical protein